MSNDELVKPTKVT